MDRRALNPNSVFYTDQAPSPAFSTLNPGSALNRRTLFTGTFEKEGTECIMPFPSLHIIELSCVSEQIFSHHHNKENGKNNKAPKKILEILALKIWLTVISVAE